MLRRSSAALLLICVSLSLFGCVSVPQARHTPTAAVIAIPGDFDSQDYRTLAESAFAAMSEIKGRADSYCGLIVLDLARNYYKYTNPATQHDADSCRYIKPTPDPTRYLIVGQYYNHTLDRHDFMHIYPYDNEYFSEADIKAAKQVGGLSFLVTPSGKMRYFNPASHRIFRDYQNDFGSLRHQDRYAKGDRLIYDSDTLQFKIL